MLFSKYQDLTLFDRDRGAYTPLQLNLGAQEKKYLPVQELDIRYKLFSM